HNVSMSETLPVKPISPEGGSTPDGWAIAGILLCIVAFWTLQHPYEGIVHDSILYAFSALARLHPDSLSQDVYLSVGTQDHYTIFTPILAAAAQRWGGEHAAATITLLAEIGFFFCGWLLARSLFPRALAIGCLAALVILPSDYGAKHIFSYVDPFMTPRVPAE